MAKPTPLPPGKYVATIVKTRKRRKDAHPQDGVPRLNVWLKLPDGTTSKHVMKANRDG